MFMCYISCIPLNIAATACMLAGPWLCCHVGNPECRVVLVERIWASVVQRVPVLRCCQPKWKLAFAGRWHCNTSSYILGTSLPQRSGQSFRRKRQKCTIISVFGTGCPKYIFARFHIYNSYRCHTPFSQMRLRWQAMAIKPSYTHDSVETLKPFLSSYLRQIDSE